MFEAGGGAVVHPNPRQASGSVRAANYPPNVSCCNVVVYVLCVYIVI